ncbi:hypothetical protein [Pseudorhodoferax soli]|nr:hypothetical protein [Pseudorhodoferax soli]
MHASHPMPFGLPVRCEGGAGLRRWAPAARSGAACRGLAARSPIGRETAL